jgi:hypothetical protein
VTDYKLLKKDSTGSRFIRKFHHEQYNLLFGSILPTCILPQGIPDFESFNGYGKNETDESPWKCKNMRPWRPIRL